MSTETTQPTPGQTWLKEAFAKAHATDISSAGIVHALQNAVDREHPVTLDDAARLENKTLRSSQPSLPGRDWLKNLFSRTRSDKINDRQIVEALQYTIDEEGPTTLDDAVQLEQNYLQGLQVRMEAIEKAANTRIGNGRASPGDGRLNVTIIGRPPAPATA